MNVNMETAVNIELGDAAAHDCPCCGKKSETVHGFLYGRDGATSVYFAGYTHGHPERRANMLLSVGGWGEGTTEADRRAVALQATAEAGRFILTSRHRKPRPGWERPSWDLCKAQTSYPTTSGCGL